jgi:hypothetical protein
MFHASESTTDIRETRPQQVPMALPFFVYGTLMVSVDPLAACLQLNNVFCVHSAGLQEPCQCHWHAFESSCGRATGWGTLAIRLHVCSAFACSKM